MSDIGKLFVFLGVFIAIFGFLLILGGRIPFFGKLPGDIVVRRSNFTLYLPIGASLFLSILLSAVFWTLSRFR